MKSLIKWADLNTKEISMIDKKRIVVVPVGAVEAHGNHLPTSTDIAVAEMFAEALSNKFGCIIAPSLSFGPCETLLKFSGTLTISSKTFTLLLSGIINSIAFHGFHRIYIVNGHGGNTPGIKFVIKKLLAKNPHLKIHCFNWYASDFVVSLKNSEPTYQGDHGDRLETEMMMLAKPSGVKMEKAIDHLPKWPDNFKTLSDYSRIMKFGIEGFPSFAKPESAKKQYKRVLSSIINDLKIHYEI